jgi:peptidoglycan glycosyltransferase
MNAKIQRLAVGMLVCYAILFVQLNLLQVGRADELNGDVRNTRQVIRDFDQPRGPIVTSDGLVAAQTVPIDDPDDRFSYQREYPLGDLLANITGYYSFAFGATQVEKVENDVLAGRTAEQQITGLGGLFGGESDNTGTVELTVRADLQQVAKSELGEREGSVVVLDPRSGAVLAMWSYPTYDPNLIAVHDFDQAGDILEFLNAAPGKPLLANAYQERYMPGSTFKVVTSTAGLETDTISLDSFWPDSREWTPPLTSDPIENYGGTVCGGNFTDVFRRSCNIPFAQLAVDLGPEVMVSTAERFGFNEAIPIDLPRPARSYFGTVDDFDQATPLLAIRGFGQNDVAATPLQMALVASAVANSGTIMKPYVVARTLDQNARVLDQTRPSVWKTPMTPTTANTLRDLMVRVVQDGTARCCMTLANGVQAAAKTGTAQLNPKGEPPRSHAWIIAFAPAEAPRVAIAVMLKGTNAEISAGTGGTLAGPIAKTVLDYALATYPE